MTARPGARLKAMHELAPIDSALSCYRARRHPARRWLKRAAVALVLRESDQGAQMLVIERAQRDGDPWSGHLGFPGGRLEPSDRRSGSTAAIRETREELGLVLSPAHAITRLSDIRTLDHSRRAPLILSPFVYRWPEPAQRLRPNHEVAGWQWITLGWLDEPSHRGTTRYRRYGIALDLPCYRCANDTRLWGLSLSIADELRAAIHQARRPA